MIEWTKERFNDLLKSLIERNDRLIFKAETTPEPDDVQVDAYVFSAHVEALNTEDIDGLLFEAVEDLGYTVSSETEAWQKILDFYLPRGCVLLQVGKDEYILGQELARRLGVQ